MKNSSHTYRALMWFAEQKTYRVVLVFATALLILLLAVPLPFLLAADVSANGRFPAKISVGGVPVGNLTKRRAQEKCEKELAGAAAEPLRLVVDTDVYSITPSEAGLVIDYKRMVDEAYKRAWNVNILERLARRFLGRPATMDLPVVYSYDMARVRAFVRSAMGSINRVPRNAYMDVSSGKAAFVPPLDGRQADYRAVLAETERTLNSGGRDVTVPLTKRTPPEVKDVALGKFILVNLGDHTLSLYDRETLLAKYPVACGSKEWPTCIGEWAVVKAEKNPTWYNRGSTWAENMPESVGPGPGNPLGTRAITINGGGVLIHGTSDTGSIGYSSSHGCIRMYIGDVEALFNHVYINMPVYIIKRSGEPGFDCSKPPFWK